MIIYINIYIAHIDCHYDIHIYIDDIFKKIIHVHFNL